MLINSEDELVDTHSVYHSSHSIEELINFLLFLQYRCKLVKDLFPGRDQNGTVRSCLAVWMNSNVKKKRHTGSSTSTRAGTRSGSKKTETKSRWNSKKTPADHLQPTVLESLSQSDTGSNSRCREQPAKPKFQKRTSHQSSRFSDYVL